MPLGDFKLFQFKSKKQREKEEKEYAAWAFPYGDLQKANLSALINELIPKGTKPLHLAAYLICKELYNSTLEDSRSQEDAINKMIKGIKGYTQLIKKNEMPMYLALVLADANIDDKCEYPSAAEIRVLEKSLVSGNV
ncbi:MAG: hypothetical protein LBD23_10230 [Oscillospiraceae bacterium]|jgi:hypothetical protein|nr:hypothetical protein [Oscillospiraceae bacterium]